MSDSLTWRTIQDAKVEAPQFIHGTGVYQIRHIKSGNLYIGSAVSERGFYSRWNKHIRELDTCTHHSKYLENAWHKYGIDAFVFEILELCDPEQGVEREQYWLDTLKPIYNVCEKADSCLGVKRSDETKAKIGAIHKGKVVSETTRERLSEASKRTVPGRKMSEETKAKISASKTGNTFVSEETKAKISASKKGKKQTPEAIAARVAGRNGYRHSEETKAKMSAAERHFTTESRARLSTSKIKTEEHKEKLRQANLGKKASDETRAKMSASRMGKKPSEETRKKVSDAKKAYWDKKRKDQQS